MSGADDRIGDHTVTNPTPSSDAIMKLREAVIPSYALLAAIQLEVFTTLKDGPITADVVANRLAVNKEKLEALLYALVQMEFLAVDHCEFSNTTVSDYFLVSERPNYMGRMFEAFPDWWNAVSKTAQSIRSGRAEAKVNYSAMSVEELENHYRDFYAVTIARARELMARYDFSSTHRLLDVGGGTGGLAIAMAEAHPQLQATIVDLSTVTPITREFVRKSNAANQVEVVSIDILSECLTGSFEIATMSAIFPVLSPDQIGQALANVSQVLEPGGTLYVIDNGFLDDSRLSPPGTVLGNLWFMNVFDKGAAKTEQERRGLLVEAGFEVIDQFIMPNRIGIMAARKPM